MSLEDFFDSESNAADVLRALRDAPNESFGVVTSPTDLSGPGGTPTAGGVYDEDIFGALDDETDHWGHIELATPVLHPVLGELAARMLGLSVDDVEAIAAGELAFNEEGDGTEALDEQALYLGPALAMTWFEED